MTFQPPPPPPGDNPPPPPPGQWGTPASGGPGFDPKTVNPLDWAILGIGLLVFIFSFISYYTYSVEETCVNIAGRKTCAGGGEVGDWSAWHGFFGWFAMLLAVIGSVLVAMELFAPQVKLPIANRLAGLGAYALALLCVILALFIVPDPGGFSGFEEGHGFGYWASLILIAGGTVVSLMRLQQTGGSLPGPLSNMPNIGDRGPKPPPPSA